MRCCCKIPFMFRKMVRGLTNPPAQPTPPVTQPPAETTPVTPVHPTPTEPVSPPATQPPRPPGPPTQPPPGEPPPPPNTRDLPAYADTTIEGNNPLGRNGGGGP